jgi:hypothetical protein
MTASPRAIARPSQPTGIEISDALDQVDGS